MDKFDQVYDKLQAAKLLIDQLHKIEAYEKRILALEDVVESIDVAEKFQQKIPSGIRLARMRYQNFMTKED